jgi:hypothetical protein
MSGKILLVLVLALLCGGGSAIRADVADSRTGREMRTWTSTSGQTLEASFESFSCNVVRLKGANGKSFQLSISKLSAADQATVKELARTSSTFKPQSSARLRSARLSSGGMSADEVAKLQTEWQDEDGRYSRSFRAGFSAVRLDPKKNRSAMRKYAKSGKVPFRITASMAEGREKSGKKTRSLIKSGTCYIRITDADGAMVAKKTMSLAKLCPT